MLAYSGTPIPLENQGPVGTRDVHWRETVFTTELMTGYIEAPGVFMPLSRISIASIGDLGYKVDLSKADPFYANLLAAAPSTFGVGRAAERRRAAGPLAGGAERDRSSRFSPEALRAVPVRQRSQPVHDRTDSPNHCSSIRRRQRVPFA